MNDLNIVVELYRSANYPKFNGESFSATTPYTQVIKDLLGKVYSPSFTAGTLDDIEVDGEFIYEVSELPDSGKNVTFTFKVTQRSAERFYKDKTEFIDIKTLKKGEIPEHFYIVDVNYSSHDEVKPTFILKIEQICELIQYLSKLAHFHDIKKDSKGSFYRLVFILHSESKSSSAVIETNLSQEMLLGDSLDLGLVKSLASTDSNGDIHYIEKVNTFRNTIIEYIKINGNSFTKIVSEWNDICTLYSNNLAAYMSAFSFHKSRKEVVDAELDYSEKISKIISEVANKALAIPLSLVGSIAIFKLKTDSDYIITFLGVVFTAVITSAMIISQKKQLDRVIHSKEILFTSIEKRIQDGANELVNNLREAKAKLDENEFFCRMVLDTLLSLAWMPTCIGIIGIFNKLFY